MKTKRIILFRAGAVLLLLVIAGLMMIIGRGHSVYFDNKKLDYNGQTYAAPYKVVITVKGEQVAKLYDKERGVVTCMGQRLTATLDITQKKGGKAESQTVTLALPYGMDGIAINLPAYLAGLPQEVYLSKFQPIVQEEAEEAPPAADELPVEGLPGADALLGDV